jgi:hypothetical protein
MMFQRFFDAIGFVLNLHMFVPSFPGSETGCALQLQDKGSWGEFKRRRKGKIMIQKEKREIGTCDSATWR